MSGFLLKHYKIIIVFILGFISGCIAAICFNSFTHTNYKSYRFDDESSREYVVKVLEENGILYSYTIDHLKRHWITPQVTDDKIMSDLEGRWKLRFNKDEKQNLKATHPTQ